MQRGQAIIALTAGLSMALCCRAAHADDLDNTVKIGYAGLHFNPKSGDLMGQGAAAGFTPPGIQLGAKNTSMLSLAYERRFSDQWSVMFQAGVPPRIELQGAGTVSDAGTVATARAWVPAVLVAYSFTQGSGIRPYAGVGVNYATYTDEEVRPVYTSAFGGSSSTVKMKSSWGPAVQLGLEYPIAKNWVVDLSYFRYWIKTTLTFTTVTPTGAGNVNLVRAGDIKVDPDVFGLVVGYRF
jgi:outer membrane protein